MEHSEQLDLMAENVIPYATIIELSSFCYYYIIACVIDADFQVREMVVQVELNVDFIIDHGCNFGKKDMNRYREIKYIPNRGERKVDKINVVMQLFGTLNQKTYFDYKWIKMQVVSANRLDC